MDQKEHAYLAVGKGPKRGISGDKKMAVESYREERVHNLHKNDSIGGPLPQPTRTSIKSDMRSLKQSDYDYP